MSIANAISSKSSDFCPLYIPTKFYFRQMWAQRASIKRFKLQIMIFWTLRKNDAFWLSHFSFREKRESLANDLLGPKWHLIRSGLLLRIMRIGRPQYRPSNYSFLLSVTAKKVSWSSPPNDHGKKSRHTKKINEAEVVNCEKKNVCIATWSIKEFLSYRLEIMRKKCQVINAFFGLVKSRSDN